MTAEFHLRAGASEMSVRGLLSALRARLRAHGLPEAACGTVEIVLAEALNNIVEHAYAGTDRGEIRLHARLGPGKLICTLSDRGAALPAQGLPEGRLPEIGPAQDTLPEGGFGWFLIRSLTRDIRYSRDAGGNRLTLSFDLPGLDGATT
ncbi:serine/threonine-protein kinase RsbW [Roseovarius sp. MBR-78]|jgi:serine/threonine-protein kinase RsbW|uniref:ATP-binding protein n=1 Tax=Roseovarius sp. MBR-78 TaxID=3156460 RepID=UPI003397348E